MKSKLKWILGGAIALIGLAVIILREILKGNVSTDHLDVLKQGIKDEKQQNDNVIRKTTEDIKLQKKLINEKSKEIKNMSMDEQADLAKKLGLTN